MALPAATLSTSSFRLKLLESRLCQLQGRLLIRAQNNPNPATCSVRLPTMAQFHEPPKINMHITYVKEKLWEVIPDSVKHFPWKKAEAIALQQLLVCGKQALIWSLGALFIFSSLSDIIYSISRNKELIIPFGLFVGCMISDFLKDISQEFFGYSEERDRSLVLLGIGCFFVFVKTISTYLTVGGQVFLLNAANGGLMQVLWLWRSLPQKNTREDSLLEDASTANGAD